MKRIHRADVDGVWRTGMPREGGVCCWEVCGAVGFSFKECEGLARDKNNWKMIV